MRALTTRGWGVLAALTVLGAVVIAALLASLEPGRPAAAASTEVSGSLGAHMDTDAPRRLHDHVFGRDRS